MSIFRKKGKREFRIGYLTYSHGLDLERRIASLMSSRPLMVIVGLSMYELNFLASSPSRTRPISIGFAINTHIR